MLALFTFAESQQSAGFPKTPSTTNLHELAFLAGLLYRLIIAFLLTCGLT